jgi:hypothetical protein
LEALKHKVFRLDPRPRFYWNIRDAYRDHERLRQNAEEFANELGAEKVVSVIESFGPEFAVVIWYRDEVVKKSRPIAAMMEEI